MSPNPRPTPDYGEQGCPEPGCILREGHPPPCEIYLADDEEPTEIAVGSQ